MSEANKKVAGNVPRLILLAMLASVSDRPCFFSRSASSRYPTSARASRTCPRSALEFANSAHGVIEKTFSVTHLNMHQSQHRHSPASVVAVEREAVYGVPAQISTSYVERSHLTLRQSCKRFVRLGTGFSKKLENHAAAVSLYVAHYNLCRVHEALRATPAMALGLTDRAWSLGDLIDAALAVASPDPTETAPEKRRKFRVIRGGVS